MVLPVTAEGLTPNADGLYKLSDIDTRMAETMAEYDAIEDATTIVTSAKAATTPGNGLDYTLNGTVATDSTRGIVIENQQKILRK
jgi:glucose-1-phosphatase